jgi:ribosomal protein S18 acetylase RimI-like enzyme
MNIIETTINNAEEIALIVSEANKDVAEKFVLTLENNPKHPSFYTKDWVQSDFERGEEYFLYQENGIYMGCVAFENPCPDTAYLNRLSVLPQYRRRGVGERLVQHIVDYSQSKKIKNVSIGIIAKHRELYRWYLKLGFVEGETKSFPHLPFEVTYMSYEV